MGSGKRIRRYMLCLALLLCGLAGAAPAEEIPVPEWDELEWMEKKAAAGDAEAMTYLGLCHMRDLVPEADAERGRDYVRKAAEAGYSGAQWEWAWLLVEGEQVDKNMAEALQWMRKAAEQGDPTAQCDYGYLLEEGGESDNPDYVEALAWYKKAAEQGNAAAYNNIGTLYEHGTGVARDYGEAMKHYRLSSKLGDRMGEYNALILRMKMEDEEVFTTARLSK